MEYIVLPRLKHFPPLNLQLWAFIGDFCESAKRTKLQYCLLITFAKCLDQETLGIIWLKPIYTLEVFLNDFFENVNFENKSAEATNVFKITQHAKIVNIFVMLVFS